MVNTRDKQTKYNNFFLAILFDLFIFDFSKPSSSRNALRLGSKKKDVDTFVGQLESEGESK